MGKTSGIVALLASQLLFQHADAYAIDSSCTSFSGKSGADMSSMIEAAMSEAQKLATLGMNSIDFAIFDPSLGLAEGSLWRSPSTQDISDIKRMYSSVVNNIPWTKGDERSLSADGLTIYCGNDAFTPTGSDNGYMDMTTGYIFTGFDHNGADNAHLLVANAATFSHDYTQNPLNDQKDFQVIVLSDTVLVTGSVQDNTLGSLSSLQEIYDKGALYPGRTITNVGYQSMLSFTLLHELFHAAESNTIWKGGAEIYGWDQCTDPAWTAENTKFNADSLAYWPISLLISNINPDLFLSNGVVGSYNQMFNTGNPFDGNGWSP